MTTPSISVLPIYNQFFSSVNVQPTGWQPFVSNVQDLLAPLSEKTVDFAVPDTPRTWKDTVKKISSIVLKIILFPWGAYTLAKYTLQRIIMLPLYPIQSRIFRLLEPMYRTNALNNARVQTAIDLKHDGYIVRDICLEKDGTRYSGLLIGNIHTIDNGQWVLQATGNAEPIEYSFESFARTYNRYGFNTVLVNGPATGKSEGQATPATMGKAQEIGISFLETAIKAKKIVLAGRSLGGAAIGQAILQHTFKDDIKYLAVRQMTFDKASTIFGELAVTIVPRLKKFVESIKKLVIWAGCEMDSIEASKKLQQLKIKEVIVQASCKEIDPNSHPTVEDFYTDGPILAHASLGYGLISNKITDNKVFRCLPNADHMTHEAIQAAEPEILAL